MDFGSMLRLYFVPSVLVFVFVMLLGPLAVAQTLANKMDIRVLIDVSGSMKKTDPKTLRIPALQVLTQLLPQGTRAGVWQFADTPKVIVPLGLVNVQWQQQATAAAQHISSKGQYTNIGAALKAAAFNAQDKASGRQLHVILLTDGMVDISKDEAENQRARRNLLEPILQQYIDLGARVHTIGLSHQADKETLSTMAYLTDGSFKVAENADHY
jgi:Mg-chelatase subunit ChlD